ncbi:Hypothetical Protein FCC1311_066912 [Hondaea fermentalgiana]|uniref:Uncharacterized protein n=1 Tax=Hondaea fermentalgiana TaxID=2315210 RepID=A0A2R5GHW5_9STRA|nr:Hypothetical Protein FCC1311_066912 [Hondaea fermentalgiana]|eukprot:GBG30472.1 Hypothetical Protein FCC1311_066912 [Hondaea fermentalgiana]
MGNKPGHPKHPKTKAQAKAQGGPSDAALPNADKHELDNAAADKNVPGRKFKKGSIVPENAADQQQQHSAPAAARAAGGDDKSPNVSPTESTSNNATSSGDGENAPTPRTSTPTKSGSPRGNVPTENTSRPSAQNSPHPSPRDAEKSSAVDSAKAFDNFMVAYVDRPGQPRKPLQREAIRDLPNLPLGLLLESFLTQGGNALPDALTVESFTSAQTASRALDTPEQMLAFIFDTLAQVYPTKDKDGIDLEKAAACVLGKSEKGVKSDEKDAVASETKQLLLHDKSAFIEHFRNVVPLP